MTSRSWLYPLRVVSIAACLALMGAGAFAKSDGEKELERLQELDVIYDDALSEYVRAVGNRVAVAAGYEEDHFIFTTIDDPAVNAYAVRDRHVFITRGILVYLESEAQLAALLGHEVGHIVGRHMDRQQSAATLSRIAALAVGVLTNSGDLYGAAQAYGAERVRGFGREHELEADAYGAEFSGLAGYDANAMLDLTYVLKDQSIFGREIEGQRSSYHGLYATHPREDLRLQQIIAGAAESTANVELVEPTGDFLAMIEGLPFGAAAADGVVRDTTYYHGTLSLVVVFPEGWDVRDGRRALTATAPHGRTSLITMELMPVPEGIETPEAFIREELDHAIRQGRTFEVDSFPGYMAVLEPDAEEEEEAEGAAEEEAEYDLRLLAVVFKDANAYLIKGSNRLESFEDEFVSLYSHTVNSFRRMNREDVDAATTNRIAIHTAEPGDTYESLARELDLGGDEAERLRLLNGDFPNGQPRAGDRIKIIR